MMPVLYVSRSGTSNAFFKPFTCVFDDFTDQDTSEGPNLHPAILVELGISFVMVHRTPSGVGMQKLLPWDVDIPTRLFGTHPLFTTSAPRLKVFGF
jgi:hypothetical protein